MALQGCDFSPENKGATLGVGAPKETCPMNEPRFLEPAMVADQPLTMALPPNPEMSCERVWPEEWGSIPAIRLQPSEPFGGSSNETDRIISRWRPRLFDLVEKANSMAGDLCEISWNGSNEPYPCCHFLKLIEPEGKDMRRFTDEACHILQQVSSREEISESHWVAGRIPDARDIMEWMERWAVWLPDEAGEFRLWSAFLPCEAMEALYRYVHALVHDYYLEILGLHMEWEERREIEVASGEALPRPDGPPPEVIVYWHPRLVLDEREFTLTSENAEQLRDWTYNAFCSWKRHLSEDQKMALVSLGYEADGLCPDPRWQD